MKCKKCGATLLDTDTFCSECGEKVVMDVCPNCGEKLRHGVKFCSKCGYQIGPSTVNDPETDEDEDIPITGQMKTVDIPFDIIEKNILREADRQARDEEQSESENNTEDYSEEDYPEDEYYEEEYDNGYDEEYEEGYDEDYDDQDEPKGKSSLTSRLFTAGIIVLGLVIVLIIAAFFFNNRSTDTDTESEVTEQTEETVTEETAEEETTGPETIGTVTISTDANIRDYPSKDNSNVILTAAAGTTYEYYGYADGSEDWVHIKVDDSTDGYVYKGLVTIN